MPTFDYQNSANTARQLIQKFGNTVSVKSTESTFDPATGTTVDVETVGHAQAVILPATKARIQALGVRFAEQGSLIQEVIAFAYMDGLSLPFEPRPSMSLTAADGTLWYIMGVTPLYDQTGGAVMYSVALRS